MIPEMISVTNIATHWENETSFTQVKVHRS